MLLWPKRSRRFCERIELAEDLAAGSDRDERVIRGRLDAADEVAAVHDAQ
jgi:hypothetical protein